MLCTTKQNLTTLQKIVQIQFPFLEGSYQWFIGRNVIRKDKIIHIGYNKLSFYKLKGAYSSFLLAGDEFQS